MSGVGHPVQGFRDELLKPVLRGQTVVTALPYAASPNDFLIVVRTTQAGAGVITLPPGSTGALVCVKDGKGDASAYPITVVPDGSETIDGAAVDVIAENYGARWYVFFPPSGAWLRLSDTAAAAQGVGYRTCGKLGYYTGGQTLTINPGDLCFSFGGVAFPARSSALLAGTTLMLGSKIGDDTNGFVILSRKHGRRHLTTITGGNNRALKVSLIEGVSSGPDYEVQLATDGAAASTSAIKDVVEAVNASHYCLRDDVVAGSYGDETTIVSASATDVVAAVVLGWAKGTYVNNTGAVRDVEMAFDTGTRAMNVSGVTRLLVPGWGFCVNPTIVGATRLGFLDLPIWMSDLADGKVLVTVP